METDITTLRNVYSQTSPLAAGLLQSDTSYTWDGADWVGVSRSSYTYDVGDHMLTQTY